MSQKFKMGVIFLLLASLLGVNAGCFGLFRKRYQELSLNSVPTGADVYRTAPYTGYVLVGKTPITLTLDRKDKTNVYVTLKHVGYKDFVLTIKHSQLGEGSEKDKFSNWVDTGGSGSGDPIDFLVVLLGTVGYLVYKAGESTGDSLKKSFKIEDTVTIQMEKLDVDS